MQNCHLILSQETELKKGIFAQDFNVLRVQSAYLHDGWFPHETPKREKTARPSTRAENLRRLSTRRKGNHIYHPPLCLLPRADPQAHSWSFVWPGETRLNYLNKTIIKNCRNIFTWWMIYNYSDVMMNTMAPRIIGVSIVYSTVCSGADQNQHQSSASLAFVRGIHRSPVNSPHKGPVTRKMFPFDDVIMCTQSLEASLTDVVYWIFGYG